MTAAPLILTDTRDGVQTLRFNRPDRLNAADRATAAALRDALLVARTDDDVRVVVLTGTGRGFCTGADLSSGPDQPVPTRTVQKTPLSEYGEVALAIDGLDKPIIAGVNGVAAGAGLAFALGCDRRIAAASARFAAIFVRRGLVPDSGLSYYLPRLVGLSRAADLVMTGEMIDADRALAIGLVDEVVPDEALGERVHEYAARLAAGASVAIDLARRSIRRSFEMSLETTLTVETWAQSVVRGTSDVHEGRQAFLEKREPRFQGR